MSVTDEFENLAHARCRAELKAAVATVANNLINLEKRFNDDQIRLERDLIDNNKTISRKIDGLNGSLTNWMLEVENRIGKNDGKLVVFTGLAFAAGAALFSMLKH